MRTPVIDMDVHPETGPYWLKLATGGRNIRFEEKNHLNEVFLNHDIKNIINLAYMTMRTWPPHVRITAFGRLTASG
jgi:hypothetical protein